MKMVFRCLITLTVISHSVMGQSGWMPAASPLKTRWFSAVSAANALPEYPRPQMKRPDWQNLNGLWEYAITGKDSARPTKFESKILVPYPIESALSGVKKALLPDQRLWYKRTFNVREQKKGTRWLLHFGAVDWESTVYVNGTSVGVHKGGYSSFSYDITSYLQKNNNELIVSVWDPTDKSKNAFGKQSLIPHTTWYTATSGIWQTVWLEPVPDVSIGSLYFTPDIDNGTLTVTVHDNQNIKDYTVDVTGWIGKSIAGKVSGPPESPLTLHIEQQHLWSPNDPFLYDLKVRLLRKGRPVDSVDSYFGMRKIEIKKDDNGFDRIFLNGRYTYNLGTLDQGFWPEGCYTAPTDSALLFDILAEKEMGFNTIRKHLKVEPARWYYHADRLGMLVWQDVPARYPRIDSSTDTKEARVQFEIEMEDEFRQLHNAPSIVMWILFNEDWAIYDKARLEAWAYHTDPSRLINTNTGSKKDPGLSGHLSVVHHYCYPVMPPLIPGKAAVLGEFGGVTDVIEDHDWVPNKQWGHGEVMPGQDFPWIYEDMMRRVKEYERKGLSASIFTQPYDVEQEKCGLMTYDRVVLKIPMQTIRKINNLIYRDQEAQAKK